MDQSQFFAHINSLPVRQLVAVMRAINNGPLGYDFSKKSKVELQAHAHTLAQAYAEKHATYDTAWGNIEDFLKDQREATDGGAGGTVSALSTGEAEDSGLEDDEDSSSGGDEGEISPPGGGRDSEDGPADGAPKDGESKAKGQGEGEGKDGKDKSKGKGNKPKKEPITPEEKLAALMKEIMGNGEDEDDKPESLTPEQIEAMVQKAMEDRAEKNTFRVQMVSPELSPQLETDEKPRHEVFKEVLHAINQGLNVLLVGPAGCGKTHMAEQVAEAMGKKFRFTGAVASEYKLLGFITATGTPVRTEYREAYEHGAVFLWDEIDASAAQAMLSFNAGLANGHQDFPDAIVSRHPDFRAIASANTYGTGADRQYVGRNQLDAASLDRFYVIEMDYDHDLERALYGKGEWVQYVQAARKATRKVGIRHVVSMRAIDMGLRMLKTGIPRGNIERAVLWKHLKKDDVIKIKGVMGLGV